MEKTERPVTPSTPRTPVSDDSDEDTTPEITPEEQISTPTPSPKEKQQWPSEAGELLKALKRITRDYKMAQKTQSTLVERHKKYQEKCDKLKAKIKLLESKPHRRRSPNLAKIKRQETAWMAACKMIAATQGVKYLVPQIGTEVYKQVREMQAKLQADEPERFKRKVPEAKRQKKAQSKSEDKKTKEKKLICVTESCEVK
jgi:sugar-specific transcriptional regulator TrmB